MIYGIGTDITQVSRFKKWLDSPDMIERFFNEKEIMNNGCESARLQHYAARFAAKEAFSKALGTGLVGFDLKDVFIVNNECGKPLIKVEKKAEELMNKLVGDCIIHVSLTHEKEYAAAFVIIEKK